MSDMTHLEQYDVDDLARLPTLSQGQAEDLRVDEGGVRWWLSRVGPEDGQDYPIGVEVCVRGRWSEVHRYGDWDQWHRHRDDEDVEDVEDDEEE